MLNKDYCFKCFSDKYLPCIDDILFESEKDFNDLWKVGKVICFCQSGVKTNSLPPKECPFAVEHLMKEEK